MFDSAKALAFENVPSRDEVSLKMLSIHPSQVSESLASFFILMGSVFDVSGSY
jgi:hypothetical protein